MKTDLEGLQNYTKEIQKLETYLFECVPKSQAYPTQLKNLKNKNITKKSDYKYKAINHWIMFILRLEGKNSGPNIKSFNGVFHVAENLYMFHLNFCTLRKR